MKLSGSVDFNARVEEYARKDIPLLRAEANVEKALETIRREGVGERVIYFYAVDEQNRLVGVVPTRRLLTATPETLLRRHHGPTSDRDSRERDCSGGVRIFCALQVARLSRGGRGTANRRRG